jgi:hypothetical protein
LMARATCEGCMSIDVRRWHREGLLCAGQRFSHPLTWTWMPTASMLLPKLMPSCSFVVREVGEASSGKDSAYRSPGRHASLACVVPRFAVMHTTVAGTAAAMLRFCAAVADLSPAATAAVSRMRARMKTPPSARLTESERMRLGAGFSFASRFLKSLRECIGAPNCVCEPPPASEEPPDPWQKLPKLS